MIFIIISPRGTIINYVMTAKRKKYVMKNIKNLSIAAILEYFKCIIHKAILLCPSLC